MKNRKTTGDSAIGVIKILLAVLLVTATSAQAQQFSSDNQWVAPHGVATLVGTAGEEYSQLYLTAALIPEWEFNLQLTHYYDDPEAQSGSYTATNLYAKRRLKQNDRETAGYAILFGTGIFPEHLAQDEVASAFDSWWAQGVATYSFNQDQVTLDILPGFVANLDQGTEGDTAWGFTYSSRLAVYGVVPQSALVAEVFGTTGEAFSEPSYRAGIRWESPKVIVALTYSDAFDGSGGAGLELGFMYFTDPRFCFRGCRSSR